MPIRISPGGEVGGESRVPGDKSIAHRWLILAVTARGRSAIAGLPRSLDVLSTASCLAGVSLKARPTLDVWTAKPGSGVERAGSTWNDEPEVDPGGVVELEGEGRGGLVRPSTDLDCGNSGTSMRLLAGVLSAARFRSVLTGDESLSRRPMERVAAPLRRMGARIGTADGHPPVVIEGARLRGATCELPVASAQVKGAVLLAGLAAEGRTTVIEPAATRDHTERALAALGAPISVADRTISVEPFQHEGFSGAVPGDVSSAAFLIVAAALTGAEVRVLDVGLNPSRLRFIDVLDRMNVRVDASVEREELGEPVGSLHLHACDGVAPTRIAPDELPLVIDEVPALAALAAHARGDSRFLGAGELRVKESDRLATLVEGLVALGGRAAVEGDDLVLDGGGLAGGIADPHGDHRIAMALAVSALAARSPSELVDADAADVSFPGFVDALRSLGARIERVA